MLLSLSNMFWGTLHNVTTILTQLGNSAMIIITINVQITIPD